jgi:hypothetical protein
LFHVEQFENPILSAMRNCSTWNNFDPSRPRFCPNVSRIHKSFCLTLLISPLVAWG